MTDNVDSVGSAEEHVDPALRNSPLTTSPATSNKFKRDEIEGIREWLATVSPNSLRGRPRSEKCSVEVRPERTDAYELVLSEEVSAGAYSNIAQKSDLGRAKFTQT